MNLLSKSFYTRPDVVRISRELLGKFVCTRVRGRMTGGMIVETEAYAGAKDRASHAYGNRRTKRTEVMFHEGGIAYVYLCYGMHSLLNVVTNVDGIPDAVLIRALLPTDGIQTMLRRRGKPALARSMETVSKRQWRLGSASPSSGIYPIRSMMEGEAVLSRRPTCPQERAEADLTRALRKLSAGPGTLTKALGIDCSLNGASLAGPAIWIEDRGVKLNAADIIAGPRIGVDYAGPDAKRPWRFSLTSPARSCESFEHQGAKCAK